MRVDKPLDLVGLQTELRTAGFPVYALTLVGGTDLYAQDAQGDLIDLPTEAAPVVTAHDAASGPTAQARLRAQQRYQQLTQAASSWPQLTAQQQSQAIQTMLGLVAQLLADRWGF